MIETENRAREQAEQIRAYAQAQANAVKKAGKNSLIGGVVKGAAGGVASFL
jgi:hypothetical protein